MSELLTVPQVATILQVSEDTVVRRFSPLVGKGVINLGTPETRRTRRYRTLRIPKPVLEKYLLSFGASVNFTVPDEPKRGRRSDNWEKLAVLNLAKIAKQNGATDPKLLRKIADRARLLAASVEEKYWNEVCDSGWYDDDDEET